MRKTLLQRVALVVTAGALLAGCGSTADIPPTSTATKTAARVALPTHHHPRQGPDRDPGAARSGSSRWTTAWSRPWSCSSGPSSAASAATATSRASRPTSATRSRTPRRSGRWRSPDLEAVAALEPDLIVSATVRHDALYDELSKIAPTVFVKTTGPQWQQNITTLGGVLGAEDEATTVPPPTSSAPRRSATPSTPRPATPRSPWSASWTGRPGSCRRQPSSAPSSRTPGSPGPRARTSRASPWTWARSRSGRPTAATSSSRPTPLARPPRSGFERNPLWKHLEGVKAGNVHDVKDEIWMTSVSVQGAQLVLDDLAKTFGVDPARA